MKKIIALILAVGCLFLLASCKKPAGGDETTVKDPTSIQTAIDLSAPKSARITFNYDTVIGELSGTYNVTYNEDGSLSIEYAYERFVSDLDAESDKIVIEGAVSVATDGTVSGDAADFGVDVAKGLAIKLDAARLSYCEVQNGTLEAKISAANTAAVLGVGFGSDANLKVMTDGVNVTSVVISYVGENGPVLIQTVYSY